jgi:hypothetical protein
VLAVSLKDSIVVIHEYEHDIFPGNANGKNKEQFNGEGIQIMA